MLLIVSVNSLLSLKKAFFKYLIRILKDILSIACDEQAFKDKLAF